MGLLTPERYLLPHRRSSVVLPGRGCGVEHGLGDDIYHVDPDDRGPARLAGASFMEYGGVDVV